VLARESAASKEGSTAAGPFSASVLQNLTPHLLSSHFPFPLNPYARDLCNRYASFVQAG
jgi:hypothetical protein